MKRKLVVAAVLIALVLAISLIVFVAVSGSTRRMATYQGKTDRAWLEEMFTTNQYAAVAAFRAMGTNALPTVVRVMSDSPGDRVYGWIYSVVPVSARRNLAAPVSAKTWRAAGVLWLVIPEWRRAYPELVRLLGNPRNRARVSILTWIVSTTTPPDPQYVPIFCKCLKDPDERIRELAAVALSQMGTSARAAEPDVMAALHDPDVRIRVNVAVTLWRWDKQTPATADAVKAALRSAAATNYTEAIIELAIIAPDDPATLPMLVSVLKSGKSFERMRVVSILGGRGPDARAAVPDLLELLNGEKDKNSDFHHRLGQALLNIDPAAWWKYLESVHGQAD